MADFTLHIASLPAEEYLCRYRDAARFEACCHACPNYGRSWGCPPFDEPVDGWLSGHRTATLLAARITPPDPTLPIASAADVLRPVRRIVEERLLAAEHCFGGRAFAFVGECLHCTALCARLTGAPCRHPDRLRPSLEACGFDLGRTSSELLDTELLWSSDGHLPRYLTLICGHLHSADPAAVESFLSAER